MIPFAIRFFFSARIVISASSALSSIRRISTSVFFIFFFSFLIRSFSSNCIWQREREGGAFVGFRAGPDLSPVLAHDPVCNGKAYAGPRKFRGRMQPLEYAEQLVIIFH